MPRSVLVREPRWPADKPVPWEPRADARAHIEGSFGRVAAWLMTGKRSSGSRQRETGARWRHRRTGHGLDGGYRFVFLGERVSRRIEDSRHTNLDSHPGDGHEPGIPLTTLDEFQTIDVTIDGADEVDRAAIDQRRRRALLREKIVASRARNL